MIERDRERESEQEREREREKRRDLALAEEEGRVGDREEEVTCRPRSFFIDNLLVLIIVMIRWIGLAPRKFEFPFSGSLTSAFLKRSANDHSPACRVARTRRGQTPATWGYTSGDGSGYISVQIEV